jgi:two-component system NarL family sensor kinase
MDGETVGAKMGTRSEGLRHRMRADRGAFSITGLLAQFAISGLLVLVVLVALVGFTARQDGTAQAIESARQETVATARDVVEPRLDAGVIAGQRSARSAFDAAMHRYVLKDKVVRVKLWDSHGRIVYSDEPRLIGTRFPLDREDTEVLRSKGSSDSEVSDLNRSENQFETPYHRLLEVYVGVQAATGERLLFEAYYSYQAVTAAGQAAWHRLAGPSVLALLALELALIPLAWSLVRRSRRQQLEQERLRQHAAQATDLERRRLAGELHDGVLQDLTAINYELEWLRLGGASPDQRDAVISESASRLRDSIGTLRTLLIDAYPPDLAERGLGGALAGLAEGLEQAGMDVQLETAEADYLPPAATALIFRAAQEAVRNVATHSGAREVVITAGRRDGQATLVVDDDGQGFDDARLQERIRSGHFGLRSTGDLMAASGGTLRVRATPGRGTKVMVEVPV